MGGGGSKGNAFNPNVVALNHFEMERMVGRGGFGKVETEPNEILSVTLPLTLTLALILTLTLTLTPTRPSRRFAGHNFNRISTFDLT